MAQAQPAAIETVNPGGWNRAPGSPLAAPTTPVPLPLTRRSAIAAMGAAAVVVVGSFFNETWWVRNTLSTRRRGPQSPPRINSFSAWTDDSWSWAFPTLVRGMAAFGLLVCAALLTMSSGDSGQWRRAIGSDLGIVAAVCLATASAVAGLYWQPLLAEQAAGGVVRSGVLVEGLSRIAPGLPVVTLAGGLGVLACLVFVTGLLAARGAAAQSLNEMPRSSE